MYLRQMSMTKYILNHARRISDIGRTLMNQGEYEEPLVEMALFLHHKYLDMSHPYVLESILDVTTLLHHQCKYNTACLLLEYALPFHKELLTQYGLVLRDMGCTNESLAVFKYQLDIIERTVGIHTLEFSTCLVHIGHLAYKCGEIDIAEHYYSIALDIDETNMESLVHIAYVCTTLLQFESAARYYQLALSSIDIGKYKTMMDFIGNRLLKVQECRNDCMNVCL